MSVKIISKPFCMVDPYNPTNKVEGNIYLDIPHYGSLQILKVNDIACEQYIWATPKFYYPGGRESPKNRTDLPTGHALIYEKMDGTNILRFAYHDSKGEVFVSYKTRLSPFLRKNTFQDFKTLWDRMLEKYPLINTLAPYPFRAFELYGRLNPIVVIYPVDLEIAYLYDLDKGNLSPPDTTLKLPHPPLFSIGKVDESSYKEYERLVEARYVKDHSMEGVMFYMQIEGNWVAYKCKSISLLNDSCDRSLSKSEIKTTAINALDNIESLDQLLPKTMELLKETYPEDYLNAYIEQIQLICKELRTRIDLESSIYDKYLQVKAEKNIDFKANKGDAMRAMMQYYPKNQSTTVFMALNKRI